MEEYKGYLVGATYSPTKIGYVVGYIKKGNVVFSTERLGREIKVVDKHTHSSLFGSETSTHEHISYYEKEALTKLREELRGIVDAIELFVQQEVQQYKNNFSMQFKNVRKWGE